MGGVVSARKAQYFEPKYESKPSARVAPGRTGSDIFPDKKAASDAPVAPAAGSELYTIIGKATAKPGKGAEFYRYFQEKLMPTFQKEPDTLVYACHVQACVEIKILRCVLRPPRHRRAACSMAWRCRFLTARPTLGRPRHRRAPDTC